MATMDAYAVKKYVMDELGQKKPGVEVRGVVLALVLDGEMQRVWTALRNLDAKQGTTGAAADLVSAISGATLGPHVAALLAASERRARAQEIKSLCAELGSQLESLWDSELGLPIEIQLSLLDGLRLPYRKWRENVLSYAESRLVLELTEALATERGSHQKWLEQFNVDEVRIKIDDLNSLRKADSSDEKNEIEEAIGPIFGDLKESTWMMLTNNSIQIVQVLEKLQMGVEDWGAAPQVIQKPTDEDEQWAYVVRAIHRFFRSKFGKNKPTDTARVVRVLQEFAGRESNINAARVCEIMAA